MKKKLSYLLFIPALFASYYMGTKSEDAFKDDFKEKYLNGDRKTSSLNKSKTMNALKKELVKKQVEKIQARVKNKEISEDDVAMPAMNVKVFVEKKREEIKYKNFDESAEAKLKNTETDFDEEQEIATVLDENDQQIIRKLASDMPEAAEELGEIFKNQKVKASDSLKDSADRETTDSEIAPLGKNDY